MLKGVILALALYFSLAASVLALSSPSLGSPDDNSTVSSSGIGWQPVDGSTQYKVIIDDEPTITSPYIKGPYYTTNTKYSPDLGLGKYYWKVTAKDSGGNWSDWSSVWSFTLAASTPDPTPAAQSSPSPQSSSDSQKSAFSISGTPAQVNSDQSFTSAISLTLPSNPNSVFYLKGAFKSSDGSNYFGQTKVGSSWIKNGSGYSSQYRITTDSSGNWNGSLEFEADSGDSGFTGTDSYIFKVGRYSSSGSGPTWSNEEQIKINAVQDNNPASNSTYLTSSKVTASSVPAVKGISTTASVKEATSSSRSAYQKYATPSASSDSFATPIGSIVKSAQSFNFIPIILGGILIIIGSGVIFYIKFRKG